MQPIVFQLQTEEENRLPAPSEVLLLNAGTELQALAHMPAQSVGMSFTCLKVDVNGTEILPKKFAKVKWGGDVLDNDERDDLRESEARFSKSEDDDYEEFTVEDEEEDDGDDGLSQDIIMGYMKVLSEYGYNPSDSYNLQKLSAAEWDDLARNIGILPEHESHLMAALGIKKVQKYLPCGEVFFFTYFLFS